MIRMGKEEGYKNLIPAKKGEVRNPKGKPKGTKHLSTWIQEMMNDEEFTTYLQHPTKGYEEFKGAPVKAIVKTALIRAANNDAAAREWLAKHGYGTKLKIELEDPTLKLLEKFGIEEGEDVAETDSTQA